MTNILLSGANGAMGRAISNFAEKRDDCKIVAGIDLNTNSSFDYEIYSSPTLYDGKADVIIDFSHPSALSGLLEYAVKTSTPIVVSTTGLNDSQINLIKRTATKIPVFFSANMSLGVSLIAELAQKAAKVLGDGYDIEIVEKHHNQKLDAPSGTALMLADTINDVCEQKKKYNYDRHLKREKRTKEEIGIHSIRGGTIVGEHDVIFAGPDEIITISHSARSKQIFASGSINAAIFIADKSAGLYEMKDLVG